MKKYQPNGDIVMSIANNSGNVKTRLDWAKWLASKGINIFIVEPNSARPLGGHSWYVRQSTNPKQIEAWFEQTPNANFGCHLGDSYVVIDLDCKAGKKGVIEFQKICKDNGIDNFLLELDTLIVRTPSGGYHLYFKTPFPCANKNYFPADIDVRGAIGYVVGPGSERSMGVYEIIDEDAPIADAPEWLLEYLEKPGIKDPLHDNPVTELDQSENIEYAMDWLQRREPAVEGKNGDSWTYETISFLRDFGLSEGMIAKVINESGWNARCSPPWGSDELEVKIENSWLYAENRPGCKAPSYRVERLRGARPAGGYASVLTKEKIHEMFQPRLVVDNQARKLREEQDEYDGIPSEDDLAELSDIEAITADVQRFLAVKAGREFNLLDEKAQDSIPTPKWLIEGILQEETLALIFGPENSYKSFIAIDMCLSAAAGRAWATFGGKEDGGGFAVERPMTVVYLAGEGKAGIATLRRPAWRKARGIPDGVELPFYIVDEMPHFKNHGDIAAIVLAIQKRGIQPDIIVVDTVARAMLGMDENSTKDTGLFVGACDYLKQVFHCTVLGVHHSGHGDKSRSRGNSNNEASFETRFRISSDTKKMTALIENQKQKDGAQVANNLHFQGKEARSDSMTRPSLVFDRVTPSVNMALTKDQKRVYDVEKALEKVGGIERKTVSTVALSQTIVHMRLENDPDTERVTDLWARTQMEKNEARNLQRQAKLKKDGKPGILTHLVVGEPEGGSLLWRLHLKDKP